MVFVTKCAALACLWAFFFLFFGVPEHVRTTGTFFSAAFNSFARVKWKESVR